MKLLAVTPQHRMHREQVMDLFWPDADSEVAGAALRKAVHFARKALGQNDLISTNRGTLALLALGSHGCQPCSIGFRLAAASALAGMGELDQVGRRLGEAERIAGMWHGGPWAAAVWEARGIQRRAERNDARAVSAFEEAASRYASLGRSSDETRCRAQIAELSRIA